MEVSEIIDQIDILSYISQFCELEEKADGEFWGLSPLKDENTPSFSVNPEKQLFYDFSSGQGGSVLDFAIAYHGCGFSKALQLLKDYAKISDETVGTTVRLQATSVAKKFGRKCRKKHPEPRGSPLPEDYMDRYERNPDKLRIWQNEGIAPESMERFQVRYDPVSDRIVYPIRDMTGQIINVGGRTLDPDCKAKKLRKYTYFKPLGVLDTIYGFAENREEILRKKEIILFEGAKSVMMADGWGIRNCGAILTSHLNPQQFRLLIRLGITVVFALDAEVDIRQDANIMRLLPYTRVEWVRNRRGLLHDKDSPVDQGREVFQTLYEERGRLR